MPDCNMPIPGVSIAAQEVQDKFDLIQSWTESALAGVASNIAGIAAPVQAFVPTIKTPYTPVTSLPISLSATPPTAPTFGTVTASPIISAPEVTPPTAPTFDPVSASPIMSATPITIDEIDLSGQPTVDFSRPSMTLAQTLASTITTQINAGGLTMPQAQWDAMLARAHAKVAASVAAEVSKATRDHGRRGWFLESGTLARRIDAANEVGLVEINKATMDGLLKEADMKVQGMWKAIDQGTTLEKLWIDLYQVDAGVFESKSRAWGIGIDGQAKQRAALAEASKVLVAMLGADTERFKAEISAGVQINATKKDAYVSEAEVFKAQAGYAVSLLESDTKRFEAEIDGGVKVEGLKGTAASAAAEIFAATARYDAVRVEAWGQEQRTAAADAEAQARIAVANADVASRERLAVMQAGMDAAKAITQVYETLAGGGMSAMHVSANIGSSVSQGWDYNQTCSTNSDYNWNFSATSWPA